MLEQPAVVVMTAALFYEWEVGSRKREAGNRFRIERT